MPGKPIGAAEASASRLDLAAVRGHFPALNGRGPGGRPVAYFDNPAGTQICSESLARISRYLVEDNANHGGVFASSRRSDAMVQDTRQAMADFLGGSRADEIIFGANMTTLTLHLSRSLARELSAGDEIVVTRLDHDANISPWLLIAQDHGCVVRWVDFDPADCSWSAGELSRQLSTRTRIVAMGCASNSTGTVNPVADAARLAHDAGALVFVDAVHHAPHRPIDVAAIGSDFLVCSAYKFFGPHAGILWGRRELLDRLSPYKVRPASDETPHRWETGTHSFEAIAGVAGAIEYLEWIGRTFGAAADRAGRRETLRAGMAAIREQEDSLSRAMLAGLGSIRGVRIHGVTDDLRRRVATFAFTLEGWHPARICEELDRSGIYAWNGNYYAPEVTRRLGLEASGGMVRVGAAHYNTMEEVERLVEAVGSIATRRP